MSNKGNMIILAVFLVIGAVIGWLSHSYLTKPQIKTITLPAKIKTETKTVIKYVPKKTKEDTDVDIQIPKQKITVKINDQVTELKKDDKEKYMFEKNKLQLNQQSQIDLNIHVPIIRKRWGVGVGYNNKNGEAYILKFPIPKSEKVDGWIYKDSNSITGGIMVSF